MPAPQRSGWGNGTKTIPSYGCRVRHVAGVCQDLANIYREDRERYVEHVWREQIAQETLIV